MFLENKLASRVSRASNSVHNGASGSRLGYLPGLDGLRAFAVIAVLLYHADLHWAQGGFLGVEIFFVISGYLITSLLLAEWAEHGRINLARFWLRRARRLLPALFLLIGLALTFAVLFLPNEVATLRGDAEAALLYVTNWYFILGQKSYFEFTGRPSLFQHLWSLAVEEQFYLIWPVLLTILLRLLKPRRTFFVALAGALLSGLAMALLYQPDNDPSRVYYGTDTRAAGLLLGAALAFVWRPWQPNDRSQPNSVKANQLPRLSGLERTPPLLLDLIGLLGLATLTWACLQVSEFDPLLYQGGFVLVSLVTAVVITAAVHPRAHIGRQLLSFRPLVWLGERSYSIYLWHWPICALTRPQLDVPLDGLPLLIIRFGLTLLIAGLSYRYIEVPIRRGSPGAAWQAFLQAHGARRWELGLKWLGSGAIVLILALMLGESVVSAQAPAVPSYLADLATSTPSVALTPTRTAHLNTRPKSPTPTARATSSSDALPTPDLTAADMPIRSRNRPNPITLTPTLITTITDTVSFTITTPITAIGDSVMLEATPALRQALPNIDVDAVIGRQPSTVVGILTARRTGATLAPVVLIHLGNNGLFTTAQFDKIMAALAGARRVIIVNNKVPRAWQDVNNQTLEQGVRRYANAVLVDWYTASKDHPEYFWGDGIHTRPEGSLVYANLIAAAIVAN